MTREQIECASIAIYESYARAHATRQTCFGWSELTEPQRTEWRELAMNLCREELR